MFFFLVSFTLNKYTYKHKDKHSKQYSYVYFDMVQHEQYQKYLVQIGTLELQQITKQQ